MPLWCTRLFCIGWLQNAQRFITHAEPLYNLLNPLFCNVFAADVVCVRSLLLWSIKSHDVDSSVLCLLLYLWFKPSHWKIPSEQLSSSTLEKDWTICLWKFSGFCPRMFGQMVSALCFWEDSNSPPSPPFTHNARGSICQLIRCFFNWFINYQSFPFQNNTAVKRFITSRGMQEKI